MFFIGLQGKEGFLTFLRTIPGQEDFPRGMRTTWPGERGESEK